MSVSKTKVSRKIFLMQGRILFSSDTARTPPPDFAAEDNSRRHTDPTPEEIEEEVRE